MPKLLIEVQINDESPSLLNAIQRVADNARALCMAIEGDPILYQSVEELRAHEVYDEKSDSIVFVEAGAAYYPGQDERSGDPAEEGIMLRISAVPGDIDPVSVMARKSGAMRTTVHAHVDGEISIEGKDHVEARH